MAEAGGSPREIKLLAMGDEERCMDFGARDSATLRGVLQPITILWRFSPTARQFMISIGDSTTPDEVRGLIVLLFIGCIRRPCLCK